MPLFMLLPKHSHPPLLLHTVSVLQPRHVPRARSVRPRDATKET